MTLKTRAFACFLAVALLVAPRVYAAGENGRYTIVTVPNEGKVILLDTITGKNWMGQTNGETRILWTPNKFGLPNFSETLTPKAAERDATIQRQRIREGGLRPDEPLIVAPYNVYDDNFPQDAPEQTVREKPSKP